MYPPFVTVVIPVYNAALYLRECIDSVLQQEGVCLEVIAVDDGSTDDSWDILGSYGDSIRRIQQANAGVAAARNAAITAATGQWIAFLDADDVWNPGKLAQQLEVAGCEVADVVYTNAQNFGQPEHVGELRLNPDTMPRGDVFADLVMENFVTLSSLMIRRKWFGTEQVFNPKLNGVEDWDLLLRLSAAGAKFAVLPEALVRYRWLSSSLSKRHETMKEIRMQVVESALRTRRGRQLPWTTRRKARANCLSCSAWFVAPDSYTTAFRWYLQSLCNWPFDRTALAGATKSLLRRV